MMSNISKENGKIYVCPMHPDERSDKPGICSICGMRLLPRDAKEGTDHQMHGRDHKALEKHAGHKTSDFLKKFIICLILTIPVVLFNFKSFQFTGYEYVALLTGSIIFFYGGMIFIKGAIREVAAKLPGMMTLIAIAISVAYAFSIFVILTNREGNLLWELATLITIMLFGHYLEMRAVSGAQGALKELSKLLPDKAEVVRGTENISVPLNELKIGHVVLVRPGGKVPADGEIIEGKSDVNESMITGESRPVEKKIGFEVIAGTINGNGPLKIKITKIGEDTFLAGVMRLVKEAQASKSRLQILSDRAAFFLTLIAIFSGSLTLILWLVAGRDYVFAIERFVSVLVIACPHALGLAVPLVASISTTLGARNGILVKERRALEAARNIDIVLFDKTGTLTTGEFGVQSIWPKEKADEVLALAASIDSRSEHSLATAVVKAAKNKKLELEEITNFETLPGLGVRGLLDNKEILIGGSALLDHLKLVPPYEEKGATVIYLVMSGTVFGAISLADQVRVESKAAILELKKMGFKTAMITGDSKDVAENVANQTGIDLFFARVLPEKKAEKVRELQKNGSKVAFVGDGINDAPALTQADLGIAIGAGTNVAIESAGIILIKNNPAHVVKIIRLSRSTYKKMIQNLFWATGYNVIAIPLAAGVLASKGILLQPALSAAFMSISTVIVAVNALFLRKITD